MPIQKGWGLRPSKKVLSSNKPRTFYIPDSKNPDPSEARKEMKKQFVFLDQSPGMVTLHHYFDPRVGSWGNFVRCVADEPDFLYCPACEIKRVLQKNVKMSTMTKYVLTVFDLTQYIDKQGAKRCSGRRLIELSDDAYALIEDIVTDRQKNDPKFTLVGAKFTASRTTLDAEMIGNSFVYNEHVDLEKILKGNGGSDPDCIKPFDYDAVYAAPPRVNYEMDMNAICGKSFFDIGKTVDKNDYSPVGGPTSGYNSDSSFDEEVVPF